MLKVERSIGYLKKEKNNSEVPRVLEEVQHIEQTQRFSELKRYRRFDSDDEREKNTELFSAIRNGNLQKVQELLKAGVKVNIIDKNNKDNTPLHYAVERDKKEIVEKLLQEWKADINAKNNRDDTPLHIAVSKGKKELVLLLLNKNAEVNVENKDGKTPLDIAKSSTYQNKEEIIKVLEKHLRNITKSSGQAGTLLTQEKEVHNKLRKFVEDFVFIYERSLSEYYERLERQVAKSGKWASFVNEVIEVGKSGTEGIETAKAKAPSMVGINILHKAISSIGSKHNREELKKLIDQLYTFKKDLGKVREELVKSGVEVFQNFESQFVQVTADGSWERAMEKLAYDAVNRIINYFKKNTEEGFSTSSITKGIIFGESKKYKHTSTGIPHVRPGHTLEGKNSNLWNTAELFDKAGLVTVKTDGTADKYYKKKGGKSDASKYGYRLLFKWESEDRVGLAKKLNVEYREARPTREGYKYILKSDEKTKEKWEGELLDEINNKDSELVEERLLGNFKKEMGQIKQEAEDNFNKLEGFIGKNFKELLDYIKNNQSEVKNELMRQHQEASQQREEIARDNKDEHKKTQAGVENANQGINNLQKGQEVIINEIRTLGKKDQDKKPVWFDVRESVMSFSGREEQLDEIANHIKQRIVVISGLGGVGKSELAIKYARSHYGKEDSVIWINAETHETAKDSFRRLLKELDLKTRDQDGDEKSVGLMAKEVYNFFAGKESLFIFDNVKEHSIIKEFLPSGTSGCHVLITSQNLQLFNEQEHGKIERLNLDTLPEDKATEFVKKALNINNTLQDKEIKELVETLGYLPLALQHVVAYIKESGYVDSIGKCVEIYKRSEQEIQSFLNRGGLSSYDKTIFLTFKTTIDKVKQEENGKLAEEILNTIAYFASDNIPKGTFLKLAQGRVEESDASIKTDRANGMLTRAINLLGKYSIINLKEEQVSIHRLIQKVIRSELKKQSEEGKVLEEEVLGKALGLLREYMVNRDSAENYIPHVISVWNYANEYDKLIEDFIVNNIGGREAYTTHFHSVTGSGSYEVVEDIINKIDSSKLKEVINAKDKERRIPLHNAALSGEEQIVRLLIEKGANVNAKKKHEWTPLHLAAKNGLLGVVNVLLEKRANVNDKTGYKFTPLHLAAKNGYPEVVKLILDKGANINAEDRHKYTPLHFAVKNDHFKVVQILLKDDKIDVNVETEYKLTPLHFAAKNGNLDIVEALLEKGANVNVKNTDNFTPLHLAAVSNHIEIVNGLLKKGEIDVNAQTTKGNTPLHLAAEKGNLEVIKALIARNADVDVKNEEGKVASDLANEKDHLEVKNYIIQHQNKREVPISQVEQITYKRRPGTSGMGGQLYEIELLMLFLLQGITQKEDKKIDSFYLATNMEEAGDFDDVVFKYRYNENGAEKSKIVFLQAKHKETEKNEKETKAKEKKITIDTLLSKSEKGDFLLRKYLSTYRKIKQLRLKEDHLIFKDGIESCDFVIYTNAVFNFDKSKDSVEKAYVEPGDILNLKGKSQEYYKLNADEKVMDALRHSLDYEILVRELAQSVSSGSIDGNKSIFKDYQVSLAERVIEKKNQREGKLREEFLNGEQEFSSAFFEEIKKKEFAKKSVDELKEELRKKNIQLPNNFGSAEENDLKLPFPSKLFSDEEIEEFLSELKLFVSQPNEGQLGEIIKQKIQSIYKVEQNDIDTVFSDVEYKVRKWWREGDGYITESNKFFQESARVSINFDVKEPVTLFTGRIRELEDLHRILQEGGEAVISQMASVTGLGGIGKSELARKYISEHNKDYDNNVIWINADNYLTIAESFRRLAQDKLRISTTDENGKEKEIKLIVEDVYRFFTKRHRSSLFVFDNAGKHKAVREGEEAEGIDKFLPSGPNKPHVLITSRNQEWGEIKSLPLGVFTEEEAIELIEKALKDIVALEENEVKRLAKELQYLPLALRQAVAYIKVENQGLNKWEGGKFTIGSYLEQFKEKANELLSRESSETHDRYTGTVMTTWQITIDKIKQKKVRGGKQALEILDVMAYLAPDKIPVDEIFSKLIGDEEVRHSAVELLDQYSMANLDGGKLNIHRLVQQVTRIALEEQGEDKKIVEKAFFLLKKSFPYGSGKNTQEDCSKKKELLPHLEVFLSYIDSWLKKKPENKQKVEEGYLVDLLTWMGDGYYNFGNSGRVKGLLERALKLEEKHYGPDHFEVAITLENLGNAYGDLGDHQKKKELLERALPILEKHYGPDYFEVAKVLVNLGNAYGDLGDHQKKKELLERALEINEKHYRPDHFEVAITLVNLGNAYLVVGDSHKAKELLERALEINEKHYGPDHFEVAITLENLGNAYGDLGDRQKKKELLERALPILEKHYGPGHFQVAIALVNLGNAYFSLGRSHKAKELLERALAIKEKHYGPDHFEVAITLENLGNAYGGLGDHQKKKELLERALAIKEKYYEPDYFQVAITLENLGNAYGDLGDHQKKKELLKRALEINKKHYGAEHFEVAKVLVNLGNAYLVVGDSHKAKELLERALPILEKHYGPDYFEVAKVLVNLGNAYLVVGDSHKAKELLERALAIEEKHNRPTVTKLRELLSKLDSMTPLHLACGSGDLDEVKTLIEEGADVLARDNHDTVLHQTVSSNNEEVIKFVLDKIKEKDPQNFSEHINAKDTEGDTPLMWAAENGKTNAAKILLEYGADLNAQNNGGETALHWAVKGSYQEIVRLLLDKQADPNIQDNNGKTPLDLVQEKLAQDPENDDFETITGLLLSVTDKSKFQHQEEQVSGSLSLEECLPAGNRGKREAKVGECLFTWEDVDKFNEEKDENRDFSKIKIDGEKFVSYIKDLPEGKRNQLIQLADKVKVIDESRSLVNKLISNQKVINHLNRVGKISGMTMHGMMAKNVLADFLNGNYQGVAINVGFIAGGQGFAKVAEAASLKGLKLASGGKLLLGKSLRAASPFLARGTSAFVVYDLVNQVKAFKNGTEEALVGVVGDSIYLGVDAAEIGIEIAEAFEVLEGVSSVTGPIGATIGAVVFVGTDIYMAVKRVDKIDEIIHLTGKERFVEGLRAFIGMKPEQYVQELMEEKQLNNQLVKQGLEYLKQHSDIQKYVFPTGKSVVDSCHTKFEMRHGVLIPTEELIPYEVPLKECTTKFEVDLDNTVLLERKRTDIKWSREKPDNPDGGQVFCLPQGDYEPAPNYGSYLCESAIGVTDLSANKTGGYTLINLGEGKDNVKGFTDSRNIFVVNNGSKEYYGGNKDDIFVLQAGYVRGYLSGEGGINTLDTTSFAFQEEPLNIQLDIGEIVDYSRDNWLRVCDINKVIGRENRAETITVSCNGCNSNVKLIDGQSGNKEIKDKINIVDNHCSYQMQVIVRPNTVIYNRALKGNFDYLVPLNEGGSTEFIFIFGPERFNVNNTFWFEYEPVDIKSVNVRYVNIFNRTGHEVKFNFIKFDKEFNVTISYPENPFYRLGNSSEIRIGNKDNLYMLQSSNESAEEIIKNYVALANRLNKMSFFIQSKLNNETVVIGSGNYEVIHNNPIHKSHLVGNGGENVYVIDSGDEKLEVAMPEVVIYDLDVESSVDTIDLRNLVRQVRGKLSNQDNFQLKVLKSANDLLLKATVVEVKPTEDSSVSKMRKHEYCTVRLKDGVNWYNKTHVIVDNAPMKINLDNNEWSLKPLPLKFEKDKEVIIVTSQDIEENTELITPKRAGNYSFVSDHGSDLIVTNAFDVNVAKNDLCTIVLSKFYEKPKMATLSIKFADKEIILKEHQEEISTARDVNVVKKEHKDQVYNGVFNHTKSSPEVIMLSDQPVTHRHRHSRHREQTRHRRSTSSGIRPTGWINDLFGWVRSSISGLLSSKPESTPSSISQVDARVDVNGTIMLLDVFIRKVTGQKYVSTVDHSISPLEAQGYALNITNRFEKVLNKTAIKSGISVTNLNFDPVVVQSAIIEKIINGKFSEIAKTLYSFAKEACPEFKQTDKFLDNLKSNLEEVLAKEETMILQQKVEKPYKDLSQEVSRKVQLSKKPDTFLNGTSVVQGISRAIN